MKPMNTLTETVCLKRWHLFTLIAITGYATGAIIAKAANALGM
jgi:hypothetical protein